MRAQLPRGPVMLGIEGTALAEADVARLSHPLVGGVILFTRNFIDTAQLTALTEAIRALRTPHLVIAVDHEGGRVQRFRDGFTCPRPMRTLGELWDRDVAAAQREAAKVGWTIASELRSHGVDLSFTPVLDLDYGASTIIGDRALHRNPNAVAHLASALRRGLAAGGMAACGKHFPGHGCIAADSHSELPVDNRSLEDITIDDLVPFAALVHEGLEAVMAAHVVYPAVDSAPAGYSRIWCTTILRERLGFDGLIFSDDLGMAGAHAAGDIVARAHAVIAAGCDIALTCNEMDAADDLLARWKPPTQPELARRWARIEGRAGGERPSL
ncbi:MAG TPA: beta-N-acetylhexosaminidase [Casimicrobiaceae bacterium]|nr:beta-N-acetylhexosaminidase [Casimicrobiaceae bacterium]